TSGSFSAASTPAPRSSLDTGELEFEESDSSMEAQPIPEPQQRPTLPPFPSTPPSSSSVPVLPPTSSSGAHRVAPPRSSSTPGDVPVIVGNPAEPQRRGPSTR